MLYQLYETQRALMAPFSEFASATAKLYNHPLSPFTHTPMAQRVSAGFDLMHRLAKEYEKPEFGIARVPVAASRWLCRSRWPSRSPSAACCASSASPTTRRAAGDEGASPPSW
jgi:poly-beta-hydroxyalkanoate depolymerase